MTWNADLGGAAVVRAADAEELVAKSTTLHLLLDASATHGALSAHRVQLRDGADGASPHHHRQASEMFYVLGGTVDLLAGDQVLTATEGDLLVVAPGTAHAFAASAGCDGELLVVITPGVERFDFFRRLVKVLTGTGDRDAFLRNQAQYDTYGATSQAWTSRGLKLSNSADFDNERPP